MKKILFLCVGLVICFSLTGCMGLIANVDINSDGSGAMNVKYGLSESAYELLKSYAETSSDPSFNQEEEMNPFVHNGKIYYGSDESVNFANIEEFNSKNIDVENIDMETENISLIKNEDNSLTLNLKVTSDTLESSTEAEANLNSLEMSEEDKKALLEDMVMLYTFNMPGKVTQVAGDNVGVTIKDNIIELDLLKLEVPKEIGVEKVYSFRTEPNVMIEKISKFVDVPTDSWSYNAINVLAEGGLVKGIGEGKFAPERGMKISEFCQVLTNAMGLESGADETGYWAAKAIKSCLENGYIFSHGEINAENYSEIITREEAIAAMQLASGRNHFEDSHITLYDIPDYGEIDEQYKELVLSAYNSGITNGINEQLEFSPKSELTREQVCQLFYNVNWVKPVTRD